MKSVVAIFLFLILAFSTCHAAVAQLARKTSEITIDGLIISRDNDGIYLRTSDRQFEVVWTERTEVALEVNTRLLKGLTKTALRYQIPRSSQTLRYNLPAGPITGIIRLRSSNRVEQALQVAEEENWIPEFGLRLRFKEKPKAQLPTKGDPTFVGRWDPTTKPRTLNINGKRYEVSLKKGGQTNALLFNVIDHKDCKPFVNRATVIGHKNGDVILASEVRVLPIGDQTADDNPKLPRYLFIGDSISGNYNRGLREALQGKFNIHSPPTNCGPSSKGQSNIAQWLGAYQEKGRHWDVISFNFGHWDAGNDKATYQSNLGAVIKELIKTKAKLIWVTTCPVPRGFPSAGALTEEGKAPRRTSGVMKKYLNPWALEVVQRYPQITVCDQWQFVSDHHADLYQQWWLGKNVHFGGNAANSLGKLLADHVIQITEK